MAYEIVTVKNIRDIKGRDGREHHFLNLTVEVSATVYMDESAIAMAGLYEKFKGKKCLLECAWGEREGKAVLQLTDSSFPVDVPPELLLRHSSARNIDGVGFVDGNTGEVLNSVDSIPSDNNLPKKFGLGK